MRLSILLFTFSVFTQTAAYGQVAVQKKAQEVLFLKPGLGIEGEMELGKSVSLSDERMDEYKTRFGLDYGLSKDTLTLLRFINCDRPGCITDKNIGIGGSIGALIRRFGAPVQEKELKDGAQFLAYDGVAFRIENEKISVIYILPFRKKK